MHEDSIERNDHPVTAHKATGRSWRTLIMNWSPAVGGTVGVGAVSAWEARDESWTYVVGITAATMVFAGFVCGFTVMALRRWSPKAGARDR